MPNWTGESSTLSSAEAVVWPQMGAVRDPRELPPALITEQARAFLAKLRAEPSLGEAFAGQNEEISLTELVKRLVTYRPIAQQLGLDVPERFGPVSTWVGEQEDKSESIIWFMADGDSIGSHLESLAASIGEAEALQSFSAGMRAWAAGLYQQVPAVMQGKALVVYAGGDDVFGALHETEPGATDLGPGDLWCWLREFPRLWQGCGQQNLTVSMGLVWADSKVPQREALQHARDAEASAKERGRNRFALRLLYASGNHLEWSCPWAWLEPILSHYRDREGRSGDRANWRHLADDLAWLRSRQAISSSRQGGQTDDLKAQDRTARALWQAYFPGCELPPEPPGVRQSATTAAEAPFRASVQQPEQGRSFAAWLLDLGRVMAAVQKWNRREQRQEVAA